MFFFYDCEGKMSMFSIGRPLPIHLVVHPLVNSFEQAPLHFWYRKNIHQIIWLHIHSLVTYFKWVPLFCSQPWSFCWGWFAELYCLRYCGKLVYGNYLWFLKLELAGMCPSTAERSFILQANRGWLLPASVVFSYSTVLWWATGYCFSCICDCRKIGGD